MPTDKTDKKPLPIVTYAPSSDSFTIRVDERTFHVMQTILKDARPGNQSSMDVHRILVLLEHMKVADEDWNDRAPLPKW